MRRQHLAWMLAWLAALTGPVRAQPADPKPDPAVEAEPAAEAGPAAKPQGPVKPPRDLVVLSGDPGTGSLILSLTPDLREGLSEEDSLLFLLGRVSPAFGGSPVELPENVAQEIVDLKDLPPRIELFRESQGHFQAGLYCLEVCPARNELPSDHIRGRTWVLQGAIPEWIEAFDAERKEASQILSEWKGGGAEEDEQALAQIIDMKFFNSLRDLRDIFEVEEREATLDKAEAEWKAGKPIEPLGKDSLPPYVDPEEVSNDANPPGSGPGERKPADPPPAGSSNRPHDRSAPLERVRDRFAGETLSHLMLAAEGLCRKAGWAEATGRWSVPDRMMLREYADRLTGEDPRLKTISQAESLSGFWNKLCAGSEDSPPEPDVLNGLIRRAREVRAHLRSRT